MGALRVAVVHDWMLLGGAEKVVEQLLQLYPDAPLYTSCISPQWATKLQDRTVITGYLNKPFFQKIRKFTPFLRQRWFQNLDLSGYDIVISSGGAEAKGIIVNRSPKSHLQPPTSHLPIHIDYCNAPTHYYWSRYDEYIKNPGFGVLNPLARLGLKLLVGPMRKWDLKAAGRPSVMIANSTHIAAEIKKYYGRDSTVIYPPVDVARFITPISQLPSPNKTRKGFVVAGRQTPYKKFDLAVQAATKLNLPLTVLGDGPDHARLVGLAGPTVTFKTSVSDAQMVTAFQTAKGFIFAGLDDFGITPVEAMAAGTPVIAYKAGGALDYVVEGQTGTFFANQTVQSLIDALEKFQTLTFIEETVVKKADEFSVETFKKSISEFINKEYKRS